MTLGRRIFLKNLILISSLMILATVSIVGLASLRRDAQVALDEYQELRISEDIRARLALMSYACRTSGEPPNEQSIHGVIEDLQHFAALQDEDIDEPVAHNAREKQEAMDGIADLNQLLDRLHATSGPAATDQIVASLDTTIARMVSISSTCDHLIKATQRAADRGLINTMIVLTILSLSIIIGAVMVSISLSRSILGPLRRLQAGVRRVSQARFSDRLAAEGDVEFAELARDFNRMAAELDGFYRRLEEMVANKSRELVRSERLASVGYLAAGVAHEINNPLGIISGHAELLERRLANSGDTAFAGRAREALRVIRNEAFRCKEITTRLLSLARKDTSARQKTSLASIVADVALLVRGLKPLRNRRLVVRLDPLHEPLDIVANSTEMKQVLLNLVVNALEAVDDHRAQVIIEGRREAGRVMLQITDNGRGMPPEVLEHVFEPFFTEKRGVGAPGTGLGLSISHAIVTEHGGKLTAASDGAGCGACFTLELPQASDQAVALTSSDAADEEPLDAIAGARHGLPDAVPTSGAGAKSAVAAATAAAPANPFASPQPESAS